MSYSRHKCREHALQCLYHLEVLEDYATSDVENFLFHLEVNAEAKAFTEALIWGTLAHRHQLDEILEKNMEKWRLGRLSILVRNLLRLSVFEMKFLQETPFEVIIDEAVILAKDYVGDIARSFVNKVLQNIHDNQPAPLPFAPSAFG